MSLNRPTVTRWMWTRTKDKLLDRRSLKGSLYRQLFMLIMWLDIFKVDRAFNLKATNLKNLLEIKEFFIDWFHAFSGKYSLDSPGPMLQLVCSDRPKIRALLRNIRSQVRVRTRGTDFGMLDDRRAFTCTTRRTMGRHMQVQKFKLVHRSRSHHLDAS